MSGSRPKKASPPTMRMSTDGKPFFFRPEPTLANPRTVATGRSKDGKLFSVVVTGETPTAPTGPQRHAMKAGKKR